MKEVGRERKKERERERKKKTYVYNNIYMHKACQAAMFMNRKLLICHDFVNQPSMGAMDLSMKKLPNIMFLTLIFAI